MAALPKIAIEGGKPTFPDGPPAWPLPESGVATALECAANDGSWGRYHGEHGEHLRAALAAMHQVEHVALVCSGTIAVELALRGLGIGAGDEVIVAAYDFPGNFRAIECVGATPVLADMAANSWCLDPEQFAAAISPSTKAVIVSHLHGCLADMPSITSIAHAHGITVVEDACQTPGAHVAGHIAGTWGDVGVLSFGGSKLLSAGRGGAVLSNDEHVLQRIKVFAHRGNDAFALSELQSLVLMPQLSELEARNARRAENVQRLCAGLADVRELAGVGQYRSGDQPVYYKVAWRYEPAVENAGQRERLLAAMAAEGIAINAGFRGFAGRSTRRCRKVGSLSNASVAAQATVILHHPILLAERETIERLIDAIRRVLARSL